MQKPRSAAEAYGIAYGNGGILYDPNEVEAVAEELFSNGDIEFKNNPQRAEELYVMSSALTHFVNRLRSAQEMPESAGEYQATVHEIGSHSLETALRIAV